MSDKLTAGDSVQFSMCWSLVLDQCRSNSCCSAGIMLMNIPYLRKTNAAFVEWILSQENGLYFEGEKGY